MRYFTRVRLLRIFYNLWELRKEWLNKEMISQMHLKLDVARREIKQTKTHEDDFQVYVYGVKSNPDSVIIPNPINTEFVKDCEDCVDEDMFEKKGYAYVPSSVFLDENNWIYIGEN